MKKVGLIKLLVGLTLAASGAFAVGSAVSHKKVESVGAAFADKDITDGTLEIRFTRPSDWGNNTVCIHTWNEGGSGTTWPGNAMTYLWDNEYGESVWSWSPSSSAHLYGNIIFNNNNNGKQSDTLQSPTVSKAYWYNSGWKNDNVETMDIYLYDYDNKFNGSVSIHAWRDGTTFANDTWPGKTATKLSSVATNGLVYKFNLSNRYNRVIFSNNGSDQTADLTPTGNYCYVMANDGTTLSGKNTWWDNINYVLAHNFAQNTMLLRSLSTSDNSSTSYCSSRYSIAKTHFNALMASGYNNESRVLNELNTNFPNAMSRLSAWATANGETLNTTTGTLSINNRVSFIGSSNLENTNTIAIIVIISLVSVTAIGGFFFIRKRREN